MFYVLPSSQTETILPLTISPPPDEVVRVLVGRMEVLTPEQAGGITAALASLGTCVTLQSEPLTSELARLGRFAEPALASMLGQETNPERRHQISDILAQLRERREARPLK